MGNKSKRGKVKPKPAFSEIPVQFYLLCKLMKVSPKKVLYEFMCNVGMEKCAVGEVQKTKAMEYFINCGYGQKSYTEDDLRKIFREMEHIGTLFFPDNLKPDLIDLHSKWRKKFSKYFLKKWSKETNSLK